MINGTEINILNESLQILEPIEKISTEICGEKYLTASKIIPIINCLTDKIKKMEPASLSIVKMKDVMLVEIKKRFGAIEQVRPLALANLLDPRFKRLHLSNPIACAQAISDLNNIYKNIYRDEYFNGIATAEEPRVVP